MKLAVLFPGQGSHTVGMGKDFYDHDPVFRTRFDQIDHRFHLDLKSLCFDFDPRMEDTRYAQLGTTILSSLIVENIMKRIDLTSAYFLGHSLGEYSALYASGVFTFDDLLRVVGKRGKIMADASKKHPGGMAAILGGDEVLIEQLCDFLRKEGFYVTIANYNLPSQTIISGTLSGLEEFRKNLEMTSAKRMILLKVSGPFHSPLMGDARQEFESFLKQIKRHNPRITILMNCDGKPLSLERLDECLAYQLCHPVRFYQSIHHLSNIGLNTFIEVGPGNILGNLVRKLLPNAEVRSINTVEDLTRLEELC
ncbi:MAG: ACP S-malonyltransferase [Candidatus Izemoplasmatales bacterium]|jgi:[acyl-carrier-protein] S-malonyltransferase|nr:ACP S-malonyltransferase [Candidatus Izemoplasmatales bacterium]